MHQPSRPAGPGRLTFLLLWSVPVFLLFGAWFIYATGIGLPAGTHNRGELLSPALDFGGELPELPEGVWGVLLPAADRDDLYITRQVHVRLGRSANRLRRIYLTPSADLPPDLREFMKTEHPGLLVQNNAGLLISRLDGSGTERARFYLMDARGFVMMRYNRGHTGEDLLEDLTFLLKASH